MAKERKRDNSYVSQDERERIMAEEGHTTGFKVDPDKFFDLFANMDLSDAGKYVNKLANRGLAPVSAPENVTISARPNRTIAASNDEAGNETQMADSYLNHLSFASTTPERMTKFAFVENFISRFPFSQNDTKKQAQINAFESSLKTALNDLILTEVANNTKKAFSGHVEKCTKIPGGIKVSYNFNNNKIAVEARGTFYGDETICLEAKDKVVEASVKKVSSSEAIDYSDNFEIKIL